MFISGFQKVSLLDYPKKIASVIFTQGCNFICPYCHNPELNENIAGASIFNEEKIFQYFHKRAKVLDGVVITGGEPFLQKDLENFVQKIKEIGLLVKIDTNGSFPEKLKKFIEKGWVNYVGMDIKTSFAKYEKVIKTDQDSIIDKVRKSIKILLTEKVDYEFRITVAPEIVEQDDIIKIGATIKEARRIFLQQFRNEKVLDGAFEEVEPYSLSMLKKFKQILEKSAKKVEIR